MLALAYAEEQERRAVGRGEGGGSGISVKQVAGQGGRFVRGGSRAAGEMHRGGHMQDYPRTDRRSEQTKQQASRQCGVCWVIVVVGWHREGGIVGCVGGVVFAWRRGLGVQRRSAGTAKNGGSVRSAKGPVCGLCMYVNARSLVGWLMRRVAVA